MLSFSWTMSSVITGVVVEASSCSTALRSQMIQQGVLYQHMQPRSPDFKVGSWSSLQHPLPPSQARPLFLRSVSMIQGGHHSFSSLHINTLSRNDLGVSVGDHTSEDGYEATKINLCWAGAMGWDQLEGRDGTRAESPKQDTHIECQV